MVSCFSVSRFGRCGVGAVAGISVARTATLARIGARVNRGYRLVGLLGELRLHHNVFRTNRDGGLCSLGIGNNAVAFGKYPLVEDVAFIGRCLDGDDGALRAALHIGRHLAAFRSGRDINAWVNSKRGNRFAERNIVVLVVARALQHIHARRLGRILTRYGDVQRLKNAFVRAGHQGAYRLVRRIVAAVHRNRLSIVGVRQYVPSLELGSRFLVTGNLRSGFQLNNHLTGNDSMRAVLYRYVVVRVALNAFGHIGRNGVRTLVCAHLVVAPAGNRVEQGSLVCLGNTRVELDALYMLCMVDYVIECRGDVGQHHFHFSTLNGELGIVVER